MTDDEITLALPVTLTVLDMTELSEDEVIARLRRAGNAVGVEMTAEAEASFRRRYREVRA